MYGYKKNEIFCDEQIKGPFKSWNHQHLFSKRENKCLMTDLVEYEIPFGILGNLLGGDFAKSNLERLFSYRHRVLASDLKVLEKYQLSPKTVLVTGASGLVGSNLVAFLNTQGHKVIKVVRRRDQLDSHSIFFDQKTLQFEGLENLVLDAVVHLAGENISSGRWNEELKKKIYDSRVLVTKALSASLSKLSHKPLVFICASATGFYGDRKEEILTESSSGGDGFLSNVCRDWEVSTRAASEAGIRVVNLRFGIVLSPQGGALKKMLPLFRVGMGGPLGSGEQWMSWIAMDDLLYLILHCIAIPTMVGPINAVCSSIRNIDFSKTLSQVIHRLMGPKAPAFVLKTLAGEMADALLLTSTNIVPDRILKSGFQFRYPHLENSLHHLLGV
jgi:uncharacterized protein (TIGR01777 family)